MLLVRSWLELFLLQSYVAPYLTFNLLHWRTVICIAAFGVEVTRTFLYVHEQ